MSLYTYSYQLEGPSAKKNECYFLRPLDDQEAVNDQVTRGNDSIKSMTKPHTKLANPTPKTEFIEDNLDDAPAEQHTIEVIDVNTKEKPRRKVLKETNR